MSLESLITRSLQKIDEALDLDSIFIHIHFNEYISVARVGAALRVKGLLSGSVVNFPSVEEIQRIIAYSFNFDHKTFAIVYATKGKGNRLLVSKSTLNALDRVIQDVELPVGGAQIVVEVQSISVAKLAVYVFDGADQQNYRAFVYYTEGPKVMIGSPSSL